MWKAIRARLTYANVMSSVAVFFAVGGAGAYAAHELIDSSDIVDESILSQDIKNGQVKVRDLGRQAVATGKLRKDAVRSDRVLDDSLTGADILESSLAKVPSAADSDTVGGVPPTALTVGRSGTASTTCDLLREVTVTCGAVTLTLPRPGRVFLSVDGRYWNEDLNATGGGSCFVTNSSLPPVGMSTATTAQTTGFQSFGFGLNGVTATLPAASWEFALRCQETNGNLKVINTFVSAILLGSD